MIDVAKAKVYVAKRIERAENGCLIWRGPIAPTGYGVANLPGGARKNAHRLVYELERGPIPDGLHIDHQCHNRDDACPGGLPCIHRACVEPSHLAPVTPSENSLHGKTAPALNLQKETCPEGHPYDRVSKKGWRTCSVCLRANSRRKAREAGVKESRAWADACPHGHEYTEENTRWSKRGYRHCRTCDRARLDAFNAKRQRVPCRGCGGPKEAGVSRAYCDACQQERSRKGRYAIQVERDPGLRARNAAHQANCRARRRAALADDGGFTPTPAISGEEDDDHAEHPF